MYTVEGLTHGIERCKVNIATLEEAIEAERKTIADYKIMIAKLERVAQQKAEAEANVHIEVVDGDSK